MQRKPNKNEALAARKRDQSRRPNSGTPYMKNQSQAGKRGSKSAAVSQVQNSPEPIRSSADSRAGDHAANAKEEEYQGLCEMLQLTGAKQLNVSRAVLKLLFFYCSSCPKSNLPRPSVIKESIAIVAAALPGLRVSRKVKSQINSALRSARAYLDNRKPPTVLIGALSYGRSIAEADALKLIDPEARKHAGRLCEWESMARMYGELSAQARCFPERGGDDEDLNTALKGCSREFCLEVSRIFDFYRAELLFAIEIAHQGASGAKNPVPVCNGGLFVN